MPATVVGDDVEAFAGEAIDGAGAAAAIVGDAMEIDDGASTLTGGRALPAAQGDAVALEILVGAGRRNRGGDRPPLRVKSPPAAMDGASDSAPTTIRAAASAVASRHTFSRCR